MKKEIFRGLKVSKFVAEHLSLYKRVAADAIAVIRCDDSLAMAKGEEWDRMGPGKPIFDLVYAELCDQKETPPIILVSPEGICLDFSQMEYNLDWIRGEILAKDLAYADSEKGLLLFEKRETPHSGQWYDKVYWCMPDITADALCLAYDEAVVRTTPQVENVDDTEWLKVRFAT